MGSVRTSGFAFAYANGITMTSAVLVHCLIVSCAVLFGDQRYVFAISDAIVAERIHADNANELLEIDARLFASAPSELDLGNLLCHEDASLALRAAWERAMRKSIPEEARASRRRELRYRVAASEFLGFCEGRLRLSVPKYFSDTLLAIDPKEGFGVVFEPQRHIVTREIGGGVVVNRDEKIEIGGDDRVIEIKDGEETVTIPKSLLEFPQTVTLKKAVSIHLTRGHVFIACYDMGALSYKLKCIDRKSKILVWESLVWARAFGVLSGDGFGHVVKIVERGDSVFLFGATFDEIYIEGFDKKTGIACLRFSNAY